MQLINLKLMVTLKYVINFTKDMPYALDLTFYRYEFGKSKKVIKGSTISKTNEIYSTFIYNGIIRIQFNTKNKTI